MGKFVIQDKTGETNMATNGQLMTIVAYRGCRDLDVRFEDGTLVLHKRYDLFRNGTIPNPNAPAKLGIKPIESRVGESTTNVQGLKMTITEYINRRDITVRFEDGTELKHRRYEKFLKGGIQNPNYKFKAGRVSHNFHIGEEITNRYGEHMKIIEYTNYTHIKVQFDDGAITSSTYSHFLEQQICNPNKDYHDHSGKSFMSKIGIEMTVIEGSGTGEHKVRFDTGYERTVKAYQTIQHGQVKHPLPYQVGSVIMDKKAYIYKGIGNFYCHCTKCGVKDILTVAEIKDHKC